MNNNESPDSGAFVFLQGKINEICKFKHTKSISLISEEIHMPICKVEKTSNYTVMSNTHLRDGRLSLKAKGLLSLCLSLPDNWDYSLAGLISICKEGKSAVMAALDELKEYKYLIITETRDYHGHFDYVYTFYENPEEILPHTDFQYTVKNESKNLPYTDFPYTVKPNTVEPNTVNQPQLNTNIINTDKLNTNKSNTHDDCCAIIDMYNEICVSLPKVTKLTDARKRQIKARLKAYSLEEIKEVFLQAESSDFLKGLKGNTSFKASFDWLIKESNFIKTLEGNYKNNNSSQNKAKMPFHNFTERSYSNDELKALENALCSR